MIGTGVFVPRIEFHHGPPFRPVHNRLDRCITGGHALPNNACRSGSHFTIDRGGCAHFGTWVSQEWNLANGGRMPVLRVSDIPLDGSRHRVEVTWQQGKDPHRGHRWPSSPTRPTRRMRRRSAGPRYHPEFPADPAPALAADAETRLSELGTSRSATCSPARTPPELEPSPRSAIRAAGGGGHRPGRGIRPAVGVAA